MLTAPETDVVLEGHAPAAGRRPRTPPSLAPAESPTRLPRLRLSTVACFGVSLLALSITIALASTGVPFSIAIVLGFFSTALLGFSIPIAL